MTKRFAAFAGTVRLLVRPFVWLVVCITAVGIHHTWFDIGTRGTLMAFADGAVLCLLSVAMHWLNSIIMRPNAGIERPMMPQKEVTNG
jgi:hypothetical protein